uniref:ULP_PROTEASE domain-containing protein n=1 Tax=Steinernema glaseri TaxID=37863 RepID=A0A1I7YKF2_9BILA
MSEKEIASASHQQLHLSECTFGATFDYNADYTSDFLLKLRSYFWGQEASVKSNVDRANSVLYRIMDGRRPRSYEDVLRQVPKLIPLCRHYLRLTQNFANLTAYIRSFKDYMTAEERLHEAIQMSRCRRRKYSQLKAKANSYVRKLSQFIQEKEGQRCRANVDPRSYAELLQILTAEPVLGKIYQIARNMKAATEDDYYFMMSYVIVLMITKNGGRATVYKLTNRSLINADHYNLDLREFDPLTPLSPSYTCVYMASGPNEAGIVLSLLDMNYLRLYVDLRNCLYADVINDIMEPDAPLLVIPNKKNWSLRVDKRLQYIQSVAGLSENKWFSMMAVRRSCRTKSLLIYFNILSAIEEGYISWDQLSVHQELVARLHPYARQGLGHMVATTFFLLRVLEQHREVAVVARFHERNWNIVFKNIPENKQRKGILLIDTKLNHQENHFAIPPFRESSRSKSDAWIKFQRKYYPIQLCGWQWLDEYCTLLLPVTDKKALYHYLRNEYLKKAVRYVAIWNPFGQDRLDRLRPSRKKHVDMKIYQWFKKQLRRESHIVGKMVPTWQQVVSALKNSSEGLKEDKSEGRVNIVLAATDQDLYDADMRTLEDDEQESAFGVWPISAYRLPSFDVKSESESESSVDLTESQLDFHPWEVGYTVPWEHLQDELLPLITKPDASRHEWISGVIISEFFYRQLWGFLFTQPNAWMRGRLRGSAIFAILQDSLDTADLSRPVFIPFNIGSHWMLGVIDPEDQSTVVIYDPMGTATIRSSLSVDMKKVGVQLGYRIQNVISADPATYTKQNKASDCGVFVMILAERIAFKESLLFPSAIVAHWRRRAYEYLHALRHESHGEHHSLKQPLISVHEESEYTTSYEEGWVSVGSPVAAVERRPRQSTSHAVDFKFSSLGILVNGYVLYAVKAYKVFGRSFGAICASQILANLGNSVVFGLLVGPITIIDPTLHHTYWATRCGQMLIVFWNASLLSHLLTSANRCVNVYLPFKYETVFSPKITYSLIAIVWGLALCQGFPYFWPDCTLEYYPGEFTFIFRETACRDYIWYYADFWWSIGVVSLIGVVDVSTFLKIRSLQKNSVLHTKTKDIKFFFQALVQAITTLTELVVYFWVSPLLVHNKWAHFATTTLAWICEELCDG